jgi:hypothetical protein
LDTKGFRQRPYLIRNRGISALIGDPLGGARLFPECLGALVHAVLTTRALPSSRAQHTRMELLSHLTHSGRAYVDEESHRNAGHPTMKGLSMKRLIVYAMAAAMLASGLGFNATALAQAGSTPSENATPTPDNAVMLTVFLKHDETRPLAELNAQLERQGFYKAFPPAWRW